MNAFWKNRSVLVTGASGFIGSHLASELLSFGANVVAMLDKDASFARLDGMRSKISIQRADEWDYKNLKKILHHVKPSVIFHLRAVVNQESVNDKRKSFWQVNVEDTKELARASADIELESFVNAGTIAEYGASGAPFKEDAKAKPISAYGETKLAATNWLKSFSREKLFPAIMIRSSVVYGPGQNIHTYLVPNVIMNCIRGEDFRVMSNGLQTRDPLYLDDDVRGLILAASEPKAIGEIINLGLGEERAVIDIARLINKLMGNPISIEAGEKNSRTEENKNYWHDTSKARRLLGWFPKFSLEDGLKTTIKWYKEYFKKYGAK